MIGHLGFFFFFNVEVGEGGDMDESREQWAERLQ